MDYKKLYFKLIESRRSRYIKNDGVKIEVLHHIVPKTLGGTDHVSNMVPLTEREHMLAHWLLHKIYPDVIGLYWSIQWFYPIMSPVFQNMFEVRRSKFIRLRDYSWTQDPEYRAGITERNLTLWNNPVYYNKQVSGRQSPDYRQNMSSKIKTSYSEKRRCKNDKEKNTGRFPERAVNVNGKRYNTLTDAAKAHNIHVKTAYNRMQSNKPRFANWVYCE